MDRAWDRFESDVDDLLEYPATVFLIEDADTGQPWPDSWGGPILETLLPTMVGLPRRSRPDHGTFTWDGTTYLLELHHDDHVWRRRVTPLTGTRGGLGAILEYGLPMTPGHQVSHLPQPVCDVAYDVVRTYATTKAVDLRWVPDWASVEDLIERVARAYRTTDPGVWAVVERLARQGWRAPWADLLATADAVTSARPPLPA